MRSDNTYIYLRSLMDTKWADKKLEKICREARCSEIKKRVIEGFYYLIGKKK